MASEFQVIHLSYGKGKNEYEVSPGFCALLLIIVFLLTFLLACHIYKCTHRNEISDSLHTNQNGALSAGLDAAAIGVLPTFFYESSVSGNKTNEVAECCICLGIFEEGDQLKVLPGCHHGFHSECVDLWLRARSSCPLCRASVLQD